MSNARTEFSTAELVADVAIATPSVHKHPRLGEHRVRILQTPTDVLEHPCGEKITAAGLTVRLDVSEATLYRHFVSKVQMFKGLIEFIEQTVFGLIGQITLRGEYDLRQTHAIARMLLSFADRNPDVTCVLVGDALVGEDERLPRRMAQCLSRIEVPLKQSLHMTVMQGAWPIDTGIASCANLLICAMLERRHRYAKSGLRESPMKSADAQLRVLLAWVGFPPSKSPATRGFLVVCRVSQPMVRITSANV